MSCVDGATYQCSGPSILRSENGVALTSSSVQTYGKSTNDLANPIVDDSTAYGLARASGGVAELRIAKDSTNGAVSKAAMLLRNLGISWNGTTERPPIIETFNNLSSGRVQMEADGTLTNSSLPDSANLGYYDFASKGTGATQANYANNRYFPRTANPARCAITSPADVETIGLQASGGPFIASDWRTGGFVPDMTRALRAHEDGDIHAGDAGVDPVTGAPTYFAGGGGKGVPCAGTKGNRDFVNWGLQYGNLGAWLTKDTVNIADWGTPNEHNQNRQGIAAYGAVTDPAVVPATGTASYSGFVYGWYAPNATATDIIFRGEATVTVNFVTRAVVVTVKNTVGYDRINETYTVPVSVPFTATTAMGAPATNVANYLTGAVNNSGLTGGLSGRYFGPIVTTGASGAGPAEIGGAFSLSNATGGAVVAGFIGRKQ
jgi:hypothetical protein